MVAPLAVTMVMPEVVTVVTGAETEEPGFLKPKVLPGVVTRVEAVGVESERVEGAESGLVDGTESELLRPVSEEEWWTPLGRGDMQPFSETLTSSVLAERVEQSQNRSFPHPKEVKRCSSPVPCVFSVPAPVVPDVFFVLGVVTPTCALMPLLQEPV